MSRLQELQEMGFGRYLIPVGEDLEDHEASDPESGQGLEPATNGVSTAERGRSIYGRDSSPALLPGSPLTSCSRWPSLEPVPPDYDLLEQESDRRVLQTHASHSLTENPPSGNSWTVARKTARSFE